MAEPADGVDVVVGRVGAGAGCWGVTGYNAQTSAHTRMYPLKCITKCWAGHCHGRAEACDRGFLLRGAGGRMMERACMTTPAPAAPRSAPGRAAGSSPLSSSLSADVGTRRCRARGATAARTAFHAVQRHRILHPAAASLLIFICPCDPAHHQRGRKAPDLPPHARPHPPSPRRALQSTGGMQFYTAQVGGGDPGCLGACDENSSARRCTMPVLAVRSNRPLLRLRHLQSRAAQA